MFDMSEMIDEFLRTEHPDINEENKKLITDIIFNGIDSNRGQYWGKPLSQVTVVNILNSLDQSRTDI